MTTPCENCAYPTESEYRCDPAKPYMCGPCLKLLQLDKRIKETRTLLSELNNERKILNEKANHHHDRPFDSIHRLPPEIVAHIFEMCIIERHDSSLWYRSRTPFPLILTAVCRRWRIIAHSTPQLWNTLPVLLRISSYHSSPTLPLLIKEWIDRTGVLPLSISLCVILNGQRIGNNALQIMDLLGHCSNRWINLEYEGSPEVLSHVLSDEQDLPQLRKLSLNGSMFVNTEGTLNICAKRLTSLSISHLRLVWVDFDWNHLTHLVMQYASPPECFEALLRAPCLTHYTLRHFRKGSEEDDIPLALPIVHNTIQYLEISHADTLHPKIFEHLLCPSLKSLFLDGGQYDWDGVEMPVIVEFLRRSGCSLEKLRLVHPQLSPLSDVASLCHGIPTLQHLHAHFYNHRVCATSLFTHLEEFSIFEGRKEPRYLPALRSLTLHLEKFSDWAMLPNIFGTSTSESSTERHRHSLESVGIFALADWRTPIPNLVHEVDKETLKKILWLREAGVKLEVRLKETGKDGIDLAVEQHYGAGKV